MFQLQQRLEAPHDVDGVGSEGQPLAVAFLLAVLPRAERVGSQARGAQNRAHSLLAVAEKIRSCPHRDTKVFDRQQRKGACPIE